MLTKDETKIITELRKFITKRREELGSIDYLSELMKVPRRTLQDWEYGKRTPPIYIAEMILNRLKYSPAAQNWSKRK